MLNRPSRAPVSTYRVQLNSTFQFSDVQQLLPYLQRLGVSECYCSSILAAKPGSPHGYDLCDHSRINPELGGSGGLQAFAASLREHGLGLLLDFVPNHMSTDPTWNLWWRNVLENGPSSPYAKCFDIDWDPVKVELKSKLLYPVLGAQYGTVLEAGELKVVYEADSFQLNYFDRHLPLNPRSLRLLLGHNAESLKAELAGDDEHRNEFFSVLFHLEALPVYTDTDPDRAASRQREKDVAMQRLSRLAATCDAVRRHIAESLQIFNGNPGDSASFDRLHELLEAQPYRLSFWRTAMHEINYRRFFDINELAGIRMEDPETFEMAHEVIFDLIRRGVVTGLRLDHVDGLFDPSGYLEAVTSGAGTPIYVVVEKILSKGEELPENWKAHGTTGYDFLNCVNGLYVNPAHSHVFRNIFERFTGTKIIFADEVYESKKLIIASSMASELNVLAHELNRISEQHRRFRDFTLDSLQEALREIVACFPVYRTYIGPSGNGESDRQNIDSAISEALRRNPAMEPSIFYFIREMLIPERIAAHSDEEHARLMRFAMKFQQYTGPVQAKGVEDTAYYRYNPLVSLNDVGGEPDHFGRTPEEFHQSNFHRQQRYPWAMLATSTHDTKRGEDARTRINVLSELPAQWRSVVSRWARANASAKTMVRGTPAPDRSDEYLYYQSLVGAWPASGGASRDFIDRIKQYLSKAVKEKKTHTSWVHPWPEYDEAVSNFVERSLGGRNSRSFLALFLPFQERIAELGMVNSLSQTLLKIGSPGVPDFYRGSELWDLSLVDPDNRRPVDFGSREEMLAGLEPLLQGSLDCEHARTALCGMLQDWHDGRIKLYLTAAGLRFRRRLPDLFTEGEYVALQAAGEAAQHLVSFARTAQAKRVIVIAPRLVAGLYGAAAVAGGAPVWRDTVLQLPKQWPAEEYRDVLTGRRHRLSETHQFRMAEVLDTLPVALLENNTEVIH